MVNSTSPGAQFGLIVPSTNTVVEAEFAWMLVAGVSWHSSSILISQPDMSSDSAFTSFLEALRTEVDNAVKNVLTCIPDYLVFDMSVESFWGGKEGAEKFRQYMGGLSNLGCTLANDACKAALDVYRAKRIGVITSYQPVGDQQVVDFFTQMGYDVVALEGLKCSSATSIADEPEENIKEASGRSTVRT